MSEFDLERLADGEVITVRPDGWLRGQLAQLKAVRDDLDRVLEGVSWQARRPADLSTPSIAILDRRVFDSSLGRPPLCWIPANAPIERYSTRVW